LLLLKAVILEKKTAKLVGRKVVDNNENCQSLLFMKVVEESVMEV